MSKQSIKTEKIIDYLLTEIKIGKLKEGQRIPSEYKLADMFNVHKSTANKAVSLLVERGFFKRCTGGAGTIVTKTVDYPVGTIAFLLSLGSISYTSMLLNGAQAAAFERHYALNFFQWGQMENLDYLWKKIKTSNIQGLLLNNGSSPEDLPFPAIHVSTRLTDNHKINWVVPDNYQGGYLIGNYLIRHGHTNIVFLSCPTQNLTMFQRCEGFRQALLDAGIEKLDQRFFILPPNNANLPAMLELVLKEFPDLTAIAFDQDPLANQAIIYFEKKGLKIPQDISITGFGMVKELNHRSKITTVEEHPYQVGFHAANRLIDLIEGKYSETVCDVLPVELITGETVALLTK